MIAAVRDRLASGGEPQSGMTLIELLVAGTLSIVVFGAVVSMLISSVRTQPKISEKAENVQTARWALERMTREIRNGTSVSPGGTGSMVSFVGQVRRAQCGGTAVLPSSQSARECQITYDCSGASGVDAQGRQRFACTRAEAEVGDLGGGAATMLVGGLGSADVFSYTPDPEQASYVGITLRIPDSSGPAGLAISDGASLRTMSFTAG